MRFSSFRGGIVVIITLMTGLPAATQPTYQVIDVGSLLTSGTHFSYAFGVNSSDQVVGFSYFSSGYRAFSYDPRTGILYDLGDLPGGRNHSVARAINDAGVIVGYSSASIEIQGTPTTLNRAFLKEPSTPMVDLGNEVHPGGASAAFAISANGWIAGRYSPDGLSTYVNAAFAWEPGITTHSIPHLWSAPLQNTTCYGVNSSGVAVGISSSTVNTQTAFTWDMIGGTSGLAGDPGLLSGARDISSSGAVTGEATFDNGQGGYLRRAFSWTQSGGMTASFDLISSMFVRREQHTATLLADGRTLVIGGYDGSTTTDSAELFSLSPTSALEALTDDVESLGLPVSVVNDLTQMLKHALSSLMRGNLDAAVSMIQAFIDQVSELSGVRLAELQADALIARAQVIIDQLLSSRRYLIR